MHQVTCTAATTRGLSLLLEPFDVFQLLFFLILTLPRVRTVEGSQGSEMVCDVMEGTVLTVRWRYNFYLLVVSVL